MVANRDKPIIRQICAPGRRRERPRMKRYCPADLVLTIQEEFTFIGKRFSQLQIIEPAVL